MFDLIKRSSDNIHLLLTKMYFLCVMSVIQVTIQSIGAGSKWPITTYTLAIINNFWSETLQLICKASVELMYKLKEID